MDNTSRGWNGTTIEANLSSTQTPPTRDSWIYIYPGPTICSFGIICNIINLIVLNQPELSDSPYTYLTALAASDLGFLVIALGHLLATKAPYTYLKAFYDVYVFFCGANIFFNLSVWIVVLLSIERILFVIHPFTMRSSRKKARISIAIATVVVVLINIPRFFWYEIYYENGIYFPKGLPYRHTESSYKVSWAHAVLISFMPFIILVVTNSVLIRAVHKARVQRAEMQLRCNKEGERRQDESRLTITLISIIIFFFLFTFPSAFVDAPIAYTLFGGSKTWAEFIGSSGKYRTFEYVSNLLLFCNSSMNFLLYCAFNGKFRQAMRKVFLSCIKRKSYVPVNADSTTRHITLSSHRAATLSSKV